DRGRSAASYQRAGCSGSPAGRRLASGGAGASPYPRLVPPRRLNAGFQGQTSESHDPCAGIDPRARVVVVAPIDGLPGQGDADTKGERGGFVAGRAGLEKVFLFPWFPCLPWFLCLFPPPFGPTVSEMLPLN